MCSACGNDLPMNYRFHLKLLILICSSSFWLGPTVALAVTEPYPEISGGSFSGRVVPESPDPLVAYQWPAPKASDGLEIYTLKPIAVQSDVPEAFSHLDSLAGKQTGVTVNGTGSIRMDFGRENAGWLEFDSPDLQGDVEMSISEYNQPEITMIGGAHNVKTLVPTKYGHSYRLELNSQLYEGVRFGWIHVNSFATPCSTPTISSPIRAA